jgi:hypothetical protein
MVCSRNGLLCSQYIAVGPQICIEAWQWCILFVNNEELLIPIATDRSVWMRIPWWWRLQWWASSDGHSGRMRCFVVLLLFLVLVMATHNCPGVGWYVAWLKKCAEKSAVGDRGNARIFQRLHNACMLCYGTPKAQQRPFICPPKSAYQSTYKVHTAHPYYLLNCVY